MPRAIAKAGAFSVVLEAWPSRWRHKITQRIAIPTIGIGASAACDGQVLVLEDMLGLSPSVPKFVKRFAELGSAIEEAVKDYASEVRAGQFPGPGNVYSMTKGEETVRSHENVQKEGQLTGSGFRGKRPCRPSAGKAF